MLSLRQGQGRRGAHFDTVNWKGSWVYQQRIWTSAGSDLQIPIPGRFGGREGQESVETLLCEKSTDRNPERTRKPRGSEIDDVSADSGFSGEGRHCLLC